jgi:hypothetical protein
MYPNVCTTTLMTKRSFATGLGAIGLLGWRRTRLVAGEQLGRRAPGRALGAKWLVSRTVVNFDQTRPNGAR